MAISDKSRKLLWGRSGSRCAYCKAKLIMDKTVGDNESVVGDECHICAASPNGPRYDPNLPPSLTDDYSNLVLLCRIHHKLVDDQPSTYTVDRLKVLKVEHEKWISEVLDSCPLAERRIRIRRVNSSESFYLSRINDGEVLLDLATNAYSLSCDYDKPKDTAEREIIASFLQNIQDWGDLDITEMGARILAAGQLTEEIEALDKQGFWVFGGKEDRIVEGGVLPTSSWPVLHVKLCRKSNPDIIQLE